MSIVQLSHPGCSRAEPAEVESEATTLPTGGDGGHDGGGGQVDHTNVTDFTRKVNDKKSDTNTAGLDGRQPLDQWEEVEADGHHGRFPTPQLGI